MLPHLSSSSFSCCFFTGHEVLQSKRGRGRTSNEELSSFFSCHEWVTAKCASSLFFFSRSRDFAFSLFHRFSRSHSCGVREATCGRRGGGGSPALQTTTYAPLSCLFFVCLFVCCLSCIFPFTAGAAKRVALWTSSYLPLFAWWQWQRSRQSRRSGTLEERRGGGGAQSVEGAGGL